MEATRLTAILEAKDTGIAEKFRQADEAVEGMGRRIQTTADRAVRLSETINLQARQLTLQREALARVTIEHGEASEAAERQRLNVDKLQASLATNERRLETTMRGLAALTAETERGGRGWGSMAEVARGALREVGELGVQALLNGAQALGRLAGEASDAYISYEQLARQTQGLVAAELQRADSSLTLSQAWADASSKAQELLEWQQQLALASPFSEQGVAQTFAMAQAYGFVSETASQADVDARRLTNTIVDFTAGSGRSIADAEGIARALGQIQAKGKLSAEEINQLAERGVNLRQILPDALGLTNEEFERLQRTGQITAEQTIPAVVEALERQFGGAAAKAADSYGGVIAKIEELKSIGLREFFAGTAEAVKPALDSMADALADPAIREAIRANGEAFGQWVLDVVEGAEIVRLSLARAAAAREERSGGVDATSVANRLAGEAFGFLSERVIAYSGVNNRLADDLAGSTLPALQAHIQALRDGASATTQYAAAYGQATGVIAAAEGRRRELASSASAPAGDYRGGLAGLTGGQSSAQAAASADAAREQQQRLADVARDGAGRAEDVARDHAERLADLSRDAARGAEDRAREHAERLVELAAAGGQAEAEARAEAARELTELDRDERRRREDLAREHAERLVDLEATAAERRADALADAARKTTDLERELAETRADIAQDLTRKLEDLEFAALGRREEAMIAAEERRAGRSEKLAEELARVGERFDERRGRLVGQLGQASTTGAQTDLRAQLAALDTEEAAERQRVEAKAAADEQRQAAADERKLAQLERQLEREREAAERAAARKAADAAAEAETTRARAAAEAERKLGELAAAAERELAQERAGYERRLGEQQLADERRRTDLVASQARRLEELAADAARAVEEERASYAAREEEARQHQARRLADEQEAYGARLTALREALAAERAELATTAAAAGVGGAGGAAEATAEMRARLSVAAQAVAAQSSGVTFAAGSIVVEGGGSIEEQADRLRDVFIRRMRETGGRLFS